jgi:Fe-S-cluster containining protein
MKIQSSSNPNSECQRCCTCCKKGGPAFHLEDKTLIESGIILSKFLYTIRAGEPSYDNVKNRIAPAATDIIKIKSKKNSHVCILLDESTKACTVYENRPLECRVLKCWDTAEIERIYAKDRLTRKDLFYQIKDIWNLVSDHQKRCSYSIIQNILDDQKNAALEANLQIVQEMIRYDKHIRSLLAEKGGMDPAMIDFLFGRPLAQTIKLYGHNTSGIF